MLSKKYRLSNKSVISKAFSVGIKSRGKYGMLVALSAKEKEGIKVCVITKKKLGDAHLRNKARRQVKSIIQKYVVHNLSDDYIFVYIVFAFCDKFQNLENELNEQIKYVKSKLNEKSSKANNKNLSKNFVSRSRFVR